MSPECMGGGHGTVTPACPRQHAVHLTPRWPHGAEVAPYTLPYSRDSMGTAWAQHTLDVATQHDQHQHDQHRGAGLVKDEAKVKDSGPCPMQPERATTHTCAHMAPQSCPPKAGAGRAHCACTGIACMGCGNRTLMQLGYQTRVQVPARTVKLQLARTCTVRASCGAQ